MSFTRETMDRKVDLIEDRLRKNIEVWSGFVDNISQAYKLYRHLWKFDTTKCGTLTYEEFNSSMIYLNFIGTQKELIHVFERYDIQGVGKIDYKAFTDLLFGVVVNVQSSAEYRFSMDRFRDEIYRNGGVYGIRLVREIFMLNDVHNDGKLLRDVLLRGLRKDGYQLTDIDAKTIMNCLDVDHSGFIQYSDFINGARGHLTFSRRKLIENIFGKLATNGELTVDQIKEKYKGEMGVEDFLHTLFLVEPKVNQDEFVDYYFDISGMIFDDKEFENFITSAWNI